MRPSPRGYLDQDFDSFNTLLQVMCDDPLINDKIVANVLKIIGHRHN
jgi:hypothetical protein